MTRKRLLPERMRPACTTTDVPSTRLNITADKWCWQRVGDLIYKTYIGVVDLTRDSLATIKRAAIHGWKIDLMSRDKRMSHEHHKMSNNRFVLATEHHKRTFLSHNPWAVRAAAIGALPDARSLNKSVTVHYQEVHACDCGQVLPVRRHWMWQCQPLAQAKHTKNNIEEGLAVRCVTMYKQPRLRSYVVNHELVQALRQNAVAAVRPDVPAPDALRPQRPRSCKSPYPAPRMGYPCQRLSLSACAAEHHLTGVQAPGARRRARVTKR